MSGAAVNSPGIGAGDGESDADIFDEELDDSEAEERRCRDQAMQMRYGLKKQQARNLDKLDEEAEEQHRALKLQQKMAGIMAAAKDELGLMLKAEEQLQRADLDMRKLEPAAQ